MTTTHLAAFGPHPLTTSLTATSLTATSLTTTSLTPTSLARGFAPALPLPTGVRTWSDVLRRVVPGLRQRRCLSSEVEDSLRKAIRSRRPLRLGTVRRPWTVEPTRVATLLRGLRDERARSLDVRLVVDSPALARWAVELAELDQAHAIQVDVVVPALDPDVARRATGTEHGPAALLGAVQHLVGHGLHVRVVVPVVPGINDDEGTLRRLVAAAGAAGAADVVPRRTGLRHEGRRRDDDPFDLTFRTLRLRHLERARPVGAVA